MSPKKRDTSAPPHNFASLIRGLYGRVARQLKVDPSYVSRVARGERQSKEIEDCLERELRRVMTMAKPTSNGNGRHTGKRASTKAKASKKPKLVAKAATARMHASQ